MRESIELIILCLPLSILFSYMSNNSSEKYFEECFNNSLIHSPLHQINFFESYSQEIPVFQNEGAQHSDPMFSSYQSNEEYEDSPSTNEKRRLF